ncbi:aminopeptidase N [Pseudoduganella buxea]|uniref:Aminopeptidase N n=1 Tax=Pseudoduganella buxea TaxID=1949069 RepID=A0A6I3SUR5_9BURK|nr:aminopeptidase N [Pseudoduganella buxea]MTV52921.1 aminopeptidase N [Pseudoduganella buxea]GGC16581.1 aminopeptidase N [Pseudoduganella buxea]
MKTLLSQALALAFGATLLTGIPAAGAAVAVPGTRADNAWLSQADAQARSARVSNVAYQLDFTLTGKETFAATTTLQFDLNDAGTPLTVDLDKATIKSLTVNGKTVTPQYNNWFITLAAGDLKTGRNTVVVSFERLHSTNGEGLHRMVDPVDGRVYTYSHFEPAAAHQMFALFDQPDLKATYQVNVTAPADWTVVSTTRESSVQDAQGARRWVFPATKKLSPYNFSLHAGPYKVWEDHSAKYPMRLFARQSVAAQIDPAVWFNYTRQGLGFFDEYFGIPYQFEKYDQLLVPDFLYGAMENAGAVTFAEARFLHKDKMTTAQRHSLASVIMHEMAHQWFGDLVTMKWWNGLWLNESFASFMGTLGTAESTEFKNAWQYFYSNGKTNAYRLDDSPGTHPIEVPVPTTANAFDNIDAITYAKGASTLKQLRHLLGEETFRKGVHNYLVKYQFQNAQLDDFIGSLGQAAGRDLSQWTQQWLYQPGVNTIAANYSCKGGKIDGFTLAQTAPQAHPVLREQRVQVALMRTQGRALALDRKVAVTYQGANTAVPELVGAACPDLVYPNYEDWGFVKVKLDPRSFATARRDVSKVADPLLRTMLWQSMWDGVRDGALPLNDFLQTALNNAPRETDYALLGNVLDKVEAGQAYLEKMAPRAAYTKKSAQALEKMAWQGVQTGADANFQRRWLTTYIEVADSKPALDRLAGLLAGHKLPQGLAIGQDVRWAIVEQLNERDHPGSAALLAAEQARDKSDTGQNAALAATVARPDTKVKAEWLAQIGDTQSKLPFSRIRTAMENLYPPSQAALAEQTAASRLARLPELDKAAGPVFMRSYAATLIPANCTPQSVQRLADAAASQTTLSAGARRALLERHQEDARCVAIRAALTVPLD